MRRIARTTLLATGLGLLIAAPVSAAEFGFGCVTANSPANCLAGEAQFSLIVTSETDGLVTFDFRNLGPEPSSIAEIYFDGVPPLAAIYEILNYTGTNFVPFGSPIELPGGQTLAPPFATDLWMTATNPAPTTGVNPGEHVAVVLSLAPTYDYDDVIAAMSSGAVRVGFHVVAWTDDESDSFVHVPPPPVPEPPAIALFGAALLLVARQLRRAGK